MRRGGGHLSAMERLARLMPPHEGAGDEIDWDAVTTGWGTRFPLSYREFMRTYGEGSIEKYLGVLAPDLKMEVDVVQGMSFETRNARGLWLETRQEEKPAEIHGDSLIAWGVDSSGDLLCWETSCEDPEQWPIVVFRRQGAPHWATYPDGVSDFLLKTFRCEFDDNPLSGTDLWGVSAPRFLHWRAEERSWERGIDPWTGEPDPYSGMFG
ncbi:hypothetical protein E1265_21500 [Streptomyces sp. 8K308]|nr:hypothetical protein E1265_21500 [Streptomyces sp. 8K308]